MIDDDCIDVEVVVVVDFVVVDGGMVRSWN